MKINKKILLASTSLALIFAVTDLKASDVSDSDDSQYELPRQSSNQIVLTQEEAAIGEMSEEEEEGYGSLFSLTAPDVSGQALSASVILPGLQIHRQLTEAEATASGSVSVESNEVMLPLTPGRASHVYRASTASLDQDYLSKFSEVGDEAPASGSASITSDGLFRPIAPDISDQLSNASAALSGADRLSRFSEVGDEAPAIDASDADNDDDDDESSPRRTRASANPRTMEKMVAANEENSQVDAWEEFAKSLNLLGQSRQRGDSDLSPSGNEAIAAGTSSASASLTAAASTDDWYSDSYKPYGGWKPALRSRPVYQENEASAGEDSEEEGLPSWFFDNKSASGKPATTSNSDEMWKDFARAHGALLDVHLPPEDSPSAASASSSSASASLQAASASPEAVSPEEWAEFESALPGINLPHAVKPDVKGVAGSSTSAESSSSVRVESPESQEALVWDPTPAAPQLPADSHSAEQ